MLVPLSWLRELLPDLQLATPELVTRLVAAGLEVEGVHEVGRHLTGVVVGRVEAIEELTGFKKPIRFCQVDVGEGAPRGIVCGASNFAEGDAVVVALPGTVLPGGFEIAARQTYGRTSDGMICSARELDLGSDHTGILVLGPDLAAGTPAAALLADTVLDVSVTPDRGYCMSLRGLAREVAVAAGLAFADPGEWHSPWPAGEGYPVRVEDPVGCPSYLAVSLSGVDPAAPSPTVLRLRLGLAGMRSISLPVDATNAVMLELGAPLHAFDRDSLQGPIVVRRARAGERLVTLDGVDRALAQADLVIADDAGPVALAGVMGGARTEVTDRTRSVVLEAAHFEPSSVARTARRHRLVSEASRRFERYVDPAVAPAAAARAAALLGCPQLGPVTVVGAAPAPAAVAMAADYPSRTGGRSYPPAAVRLRLEQVGCTLAAGGDADTLLVTPPSWRPDLREPADLAEEVLRLEGYDSIPSRLPPAPAGRGLTSAQQRRRELGRVLADAGLVEVALMPFTAANPLQLQAHDPRRAAVRLANPLSEEQAWLRTCLLAGLLDALAENLGHGANDVRLFETGSVFLAPEGGLRRVTAPPAGSRPSDAALAQLDAALPRQPEHLGVVLAGELEPSGWWGPGRAAAWSDAVELAHLAAAACGGTLQVRAAQVAPWHPGRCVELLLGDGTHGGGEVVGAAGELHPGLCAARGLPARTCALELDLTALLAAPRSARPAPVLSPYPPAAVDVALVVAGTVSCAQVEQALVEGAGPLLESHRLLDLYTGPPVPVGARSLAWRLTFRAPDRTLTGEEVNAARDTAIALAQARTGATLRA